MSARRVRRLHRAKVARRPARQKITDQLSGGAVIAAAQLEGARLPAALELHPGQWVAGIILLGRNAHHDAAVGVALVARILAHAVGDHPPRFRGGGDHRAAGAHAEAVYRTPVAGVVHQLVIRRAELRVARVLAVTCAVDQRLRVLDAEADQERFGFDVDAALVDHLEGVALAVADRQHQMIRGDVFAAAEHHAANVSDVIGSVLDFDVVHAALEADLAAQRLDGFAHLFHHAYQAERADVRLAGVQDFFRRARLDEFLQHFSAEVSGVLDLAVQFAVGERARAAFTELHVRFRVEHALPPQAEGIPGAFAHRLAPLQDQRTETHLCEDQSGEQTGWTHADHDWS